MNAKMNAKKFIANNAREALRKIKESLGSDAVILSNRAIPGGVEILAVAQKDLDEAAPSFSQAQNLQQEPSQKVNTFTPNLMPKRICITDDEDSELGDYASVIAAARQKNVLKASARLQEPLHAPLPPKTLGQTFSPSVAQVLSRTAKQLSQQLKSENAHSVHLEENLKKSTVNAKKISKTQKQATESKALSYGQLEEQVRHSEVMAEIKALRNIIDQQLAGFAWGLNQQTEPMKNEMLAWMINLGFSPQFSRDLLQEMPALNDRQAASLWVQNATDRALSLSHKGSDLIAQGGIFALVGPTGVGKTTTAAKLAARAVLTHGSDKVALVSTDNYRVGAHEQLRIYGRILGVVVFLAKDGRDLQQTLMELRHKHLVLIDTMGMSQRDKMVVELTQMLSCNNVQRIMLLNATSQGETLDDVVRAYMGSNIAGCILTKTDEAASVAGALDVIMRHKMRLHYISNGQRVPEDLHLPNRGYLLHRAFKNAPSHSAHHLKGMEPAFKLGQARG